jgi:hypothetical protein
MARFSKPYRIPAFIKKGRVLSLPKCSTSMKLIADRLLLSRACFLLGFTIVKLNKNKMKKVLKTVGLQHRRGNLIAFDSYACGVLESLTAE